MKKFIAAVVLLLSVFLLIGCGCQKEPIGSANSSYPKQNIGEFFTEELAAMRELSYTLESKTIDGDHPIRYSNEYVMAFANRELYSFYSDKKFPFPTDETINLLFADDVQYVRITTDTKHYIYHYLTTELLYTLEISANYMYDFDEYDISVYKYKGVEEDWVLDKVYLFRDYEPISEEKEDALDPLAVLDNPWIRQIKDYKYLEDANDVTIFKNNKFYAHYYFEAGYLRHFYLENGNILSMHRIETSALEPYDYTQGGKNYRLLYYLYDLGKKEAKLVNLPIYIDYIQIKTEFEPFGVPAAIGFRTIDPNTKALVNVNRIGSIDNKLNIKEITFPFGEVEDVMRLNDKEFVVTAKSGLYLVNHKNEVLNSLIYDNENYEAIVYNNGSVLLYEDYLRSVNIYNIKDGSLIHKGYTFLDRINHNQVLLKKGEDYYYFNGTLTKLKGKARTMNGPCFIVETEECYEVHYQDGSLLFKVKTDEIVEISEYSDEYTVRVFTYKDLEGNMKHYILKIVGRELFYM